MASELVIFEEQLHELQPQFTDVLGGRMPPARLIRTVVMSVQKTPKLLQCNRQTLLNAGMTFGVLALEVDGVTGQGYILPFKNVAQPCIGYKGFNTIGARTGLTITGDVIREGDEYDYRKGTNGFIHHKPLFGNSRSRIIGAWAQAEARDRPPIIEILDIDQLEDIRRRSPGAKMADSPWNDEAIGRPAMYSKSVKRRLARSTPMNWASPEFMQAAALEEAFDERGRPGHISPSRGVVIDGELDSPLPKREDAGATPNAQDLMGPPDSPEIRALKKEGEGAGELGMEVVRKWWARLSPRNQVDLAKWKDETLKPIAEAADKRNANDADV